MKMQRSWKGKNNPKEEYKFIRVMAPYFRTYYKFILIKKTIGVKKG